MKTILHETQPFSNIELYSLYNTIETVIIEANENYQKRSLRNKYHILTSQGILPLTIPLKSGKNQQMPIRDVQISYHENWPKVHLGAIEAAYGKSPYFEHYFDAIESLLFNDLKYLYDFNLETLKFILQETKLSVEIQHTNFYEKIPTSNISDYRDYPWTQPEKRENPQWNYIQVWTRDQEFYYNLSILDLLFNFGPFTNHQLQSLYKFAH